MNTYRVVFFVDGGARERRYLVDATSHWTAISRALRQLVSVSAKHVRVSCTLTAEDVEREWGDPKVRAE